MQFGFGGLIYLNKPLNLTIKVNRKMSNNYYEENGKTWVFGSQKPQEEQPPKDDKDCCPMPNDVLRQGKNQRVFEEIAVGKNK
jgi:hypothetical protein